MTKFCLPIQVSRWADFVAELRGAGAAFDLVELWMDYIVEWDVRQWQLLTPDERRRIIVVWRRDRLTKPSLTPVEQRSRMAAVLEGCALVDLDLASQRELVDELSPSQRSAKLLISHHDYTRTPSTEELRGLLGNLRDCGPAAVKLATMCQCEADALKLLQLLLEVRTRALPVTILGMGLPGTITRVLGAMWGNQLSFAPASRDKSSAPGQLTLEELKNALAVLRTARAIPR